MGWFYLFRVPGRLGQSSSNHYTKISSPLEGSAPYPAITNALDLGFRIKVYRLWPCILCRNIFSIGKVTDARYRRKTAFQAPLNTLPSDLFPLSLCSIFNSARQLPLTAWSHSPLYTFPTLSHSLSTLQRCVILLPQARGSFLSESGQVLRAGRVWGCRRDPGECHPERNVVLQGRGVCSGRRGSAPENGGHSRVYHAGPVQNPTTVRE